jgi:hypothetical protein
MQYLCMHVCTGVHVGTHMRKSILAYLFVLIEWILVAFNSSFFIPVPRQRRNLAHGESPDRTVLLYASVVWYTPAPINQSKINPCIFGLRKTKISTMLSGAWWVLFGGARSNPVFGTHLPSLTYARRCIGPRNATSPMAQPARLMYPSVSDDEYEPTPSPSPFFSLTHTLRCIGPHHVTNPMTTVRLMYLYLSVFDNST